MASTVAMTDDLLGHVRTWARLWGVPGLDARLSIEWSRRLRRSLGRAFPQRGLVKLSAALRSAPAERVLETLCHEVAHIAVLELHGAPCRPHGPEWAALVRAAGFVPSVRLRGTTERPGDVRLYLHWCPVCHARRVARRAVRRWRCAGCVGAGLDGTLNVVTLSRATRP
jgi:predicted SprT family Zn-dependent metalloprotease